MLLALAIPNGSFAQEADHGGEACASGQQRALYVDDVLQPRCEVLFGDPDVRGMNEDWRVERIMAVESGSATLDVLHTDAQLKRPQPRSLAGIVIADTFPANVVEEDCGAALEQEVGDGGPLADADEAELARDAMAGDEAAEESQAGDAAFGEVVREHVARIELREPWASMCGESSVVLRVDDAIGASGRVIHIDRRGVLAQLGGRLVWLSRMGASTPAFRTTWRSDFSVITDARSKPAPKKKKKKKRRRRRRRR